MASILGGEESSPLKKTKNALKAAPEAMRTTLERSNPLGRNESNIDSGPKRSVQSEHVFEPPTNTLVNALATDMYQISMCYAHWKNNKHNDHAVFDLFFRKCPFKGEFCIFAGLDECVKFISTYKFTPSDIAYLKEILPGAKEPAFFDWLLSLDCSTVKLYAIPEGSVVFPKQPLLRVEGPLAITQLLETTLLNLVNYASLVCTNACRMRLAAGDNKVLMEFGLRRAQGPDGGFSASKYSYVGGFDGTSNVLAAKLCGISCKGTHAHSYVMSYTGLNDLEKTTITSKENPKKEVEFLKLCLEKRAQLGYVSSNEGELAAFISYAQAYPDGLLALVDTYDTLQSGIQNFITVGVALRELGYSCVGVRLDSGDLAYLSKEIRQLFKAVDAKLGLGTYFATKTIVASNDLNEDVIYSLNQQVHEIDTFGIGTNLVTCLKQPALGCVFKLVEINGHPRIKISQDIEKIVIPGRKNLFRIYGADNKPVVDLMLRDQEQAPAVGKRMLVCHPFQEKRRAYVTPTKVEELLQLVWDGPNAKSPAQRLVIPTPSLDSRRQRCLDSVKALRSDHIRPINPTPFKVSVSESLFTYTHKLWQENVSVPDL